MRPAPAPLPIERVVKTGCVATNTPALAARPVFHFDPGARPKPAQNVTGLFASEAPPSLDLLSTGTGLGAPPSFAIATPTLPPPPKAVTASAGPIKVGGSVQMAKLIHKVTPAYPALARAARISGVVHLIGTIGKDGTIRNLQLIGGHPMLARAALEAVQQWIYEPTLLNGEPVEVIRPSKSVSPWGNRNSVSFNNGAFEMHPGCMDGSVLVGLPCTACWGSAQTESPRDHGLHHNRCRVLSSADRRGREVSQPGARICTERRL